jgi:predicted PurR-regulated permease PerM
MNRYIWSNIISSVVLLLVIVVSGLTIEGRHARQIENLRDDVKTNADYIEQNANRIDNEFQTIKTLLQDLKDAYTERLNNATQARIEKSACVGGRLLTRVSRSISRS